MSDNSSIARVVVDSDGAVWVEGVSAGTVSVSVAGSSAASVQVTVADVAVDVLGFISRPFTALSMTSTRAVKSALPLHVSAAVVFAEAVPVMPGSAVHMTHDVLTTDGRVNSFALSSDATVSPASPHTVAGTGGTVLAVASGDASVLVSAASSCLTVDGYATFAIDVVQLDAMQLTAAAPLLAPVGDALAVGSFVPSATVVAVQASVGGEPVSLALSSLGAVVNSSVDCVGVSVVNNAVSVLVAAGCSHGIVVVSVTLPALAITASTTLTVVTAVAVTVTPTLVSNSDANQGLCI